MLVEPVGGACLSSASSCNWCLDGNRVREKPGFIHPAWTKRRWFIRVQSAVSPGPGGCVPGGFFCQAFHETTKRRPIVGSKSGIFGRPGDGKGTGSPGPGGYQVRFFCQAFHETTKRRLIHGFEERYLRPTGGWERDRISRTRWIPGEIFPARCFTKRQNEGRSTGSKSGIFGRPGDGNGTGSPGTCRYQVRFFCQPLMKRQNEG